MVEDAITLDLPSMQRQLTLVKKEHSFSMRLGLKQEHKQWIRAWIKYTWPRKKGDGNRAIENDLNRAFIKVKGVTDRTKLRNVGLIGDENAFLKQARSNVTGRVYKSYGRKGTAKRMLLPLKDFNAIVKKQKGDLGTLKGGWQAAAQAMGVAVSAWAKGHKYKGRHVERLQGKDGGYIESINNVPYAKRKLKNMEVFILNLRKKAFETKMKVAQNKAIEKANKLRASG